MTDRKPASVDGEQLQERLFRLSSLQAELRGLVQEAFAASKKPLNTFGREIGVQWKPLHHLLVRRRVLCSGTTLQKITTFIKRPDLFAAITELSREIGHERLQGLAAFSEDVIRCVFALRAEYEAVRTSMTMYAFAAAFKPNDAVVLGALQGNHEPIAKLDAERTRTAVSALLTEQTWRQSLSGKQPGPVRGPSAEEVLSRFGGTTTEQNVPFVLTAETFRTFEGDPGEPLVALLIKYMRIVRAMLNVVSQIADDQIRARMRTQLTGELAELHQAIELASFSNPSALTSIFDAQRQTLAHQDGTSHTSGKGRKGSS